MDMFAHVFMVLKNPCFMCQTEGTEGVCERVSFLLLRTLTPCPPLLPPGSSHVTSDAQLLFLHG